MLSAYNYKLKVIAWDAHCKIQGKKRYFSEKATRDKTRAPRAGIHVCKYTKVTLKANLEAPLQLVFCCKQIAAYSATCRLSTGHCWWQNKWVLQVASLL